MKEELIASSYECPKLYDRHDVTWLEIKRILRNCTSNAESADQQPDREKSIIGCMIASNHNSRMGVSYRLPGSLSTPVQTHPILHQGTFVFLNGRSDGYSPQFLDVRSRLKASLVCKTWFQIMNCQQMLCDVKVQFSGVVDEAIKRFSCMARKFQCFTFLRVIISSLVVEFLKKYSSQFVILSFSDCKVIDGLFKHTLQGEDVIAISKIEGLKLTQILFPHKLNSIYGAESFCENQLFLVAVDFSASTHVGDNSFCCH
ncbi:hypothetical protein TNCV_3130481 [Trichonephila clavipes]|nr:hypothetical protein TNCV_3130481 [Trichonephila clavipes]